MCFLSILKFLCIAQQAAKSFSLTFKSIQENVDSDKTAGSECITRVHFHKLTNVLSNSNMSNVHVAYYGEHPCICVM